MVNVRGYFCRHFGGLEIPALTTLRNFALSFAR
jgi:hypothetical protein